MNGLVRFARTQWLAMVGICIGLTGVALGATGQPALLGRQNVADRPTVINNNGRGPAARFNVKAGRPPFSVNSTRQVARLNASRLGGKLPSAFAGTGASYTKSESDAAYAPASGSSNYLASSAPQLLDAAILFAPPINTDFYSKSFVAPADGSVVAQIVGRCTVNDGNELTLTIKSGNATNTAAYGAKLETTTPSPTAVGCTANAGALVSKGTSVPVSVSWSIPGGGATLTQPSVTVYFVPAAAP